MSLDPITYNEAHALRAHFALLNGSHEAAATLLAPAVTPASFAAWLGVAGNLSLFERLIAASAAMSVIAASSTAMTAVAASSTALMALHGSDTALSAIKASSTAMTAMRAASRYIASAGQSINGTGISITAFNAAGKYILLGLSSINAPPSLVIAVNTRRPGSSIPNTGLTVPSASTDAARIDLTIPLEAPFTATSAGGYAWNFGAIRCDI